MATLHVDGLRMGLAVGSFAPAVQAGLNEPVDVMLHSIGMLFGRPGIEGVAQVRPDLGGASIRDDSGIADGPVDDSGRKVTEGGSHLLFGHQMVVMIALK
jgi:hypothetical protein